MATDKCMLIRGRFATKLTDVMEAINASIDFDQQMAMQDIDGSLAHSEMLSDQGIITKEDHQLIASGLSNIRQEISEGKFKFSRSLEDIHMNVESRLHDLIGMVAGRLHTARSRNDQVATDFRLWVRDAHDRADELLGELLHTLLDRAEEHANTVMPGFTHMQSAQPITFGHHLMAYVEMFGRDLSRVRDSRRRMNESPLGAAALAGTSFMIDRDKTARALRFDRPMRNSLDSVSDRDFAVEYLSFASLSMVHLSRLSEEIVLWMSPLFDFIKLSDEWTTGSSIMPQKRNPDAAELIRGKVGRVNGSLAGLLTMMKGLPLAFSKDMQEDKEQTFDAASTLEICLQAMIGMVSDMQPVKERMRTAAGLGHATATDLADWLTRFIGIPFREAHHITGRLVREADHRGVSLEEIPLDAMQAVDGRITADVYIVLGVDNSVNSRVSFGGTAPANVLKQVAGWRNRL
ncbi:argininosuccinate lyase [Paraherbaspirillum soli]|uniref:Argininosuccinate lyase n=1 Tax=Paraherbaspirillum soli TaxID=631222 RepID=A0ABW0MAI2_9BURK